MAKDIYEDIAKRTGGDIYIGVVGPVRTGKSTQIKPLMEKLGIRSVAGLAIYAMTAGYVAGDDL